ncbi:uncharacterized protein VTP21DRAFT_10248 [Calcarisporiella thermophila]|uniref:uncharacterized protein n=1 Tax=Calcarisporiella thermophila TaxID=911321 RepID=UPI003744A6AE
MFLAEMSGKYKYTSLQVYRSAISKTWQMPHPEIAPMADQAIVKKIIKGAKEVAPRPQRKQPFWNVQRVIERLARIQTNRETPLARLGQKTALLLALTTIWRPRSDLARIPPDRVQFITTENGTRRVMQITAIKPKEGMEKTIRLQALLEDPELCPVAATHLYITRARETSIGYDNFPTFFITARKTPTPATGDTVARWITDMLSECDILATAHSTRSTSSSYALVQGTPQESILKAANWTSATTFERFYHRAEMDTFPVGITLRRNTIQGENLGHDA